MTWARPFPETYTLQEIATLLTLSYWTVYHRARTGQIPGAFQVGGSGKSWRVKRQSFDAWFASGCPVLTTKVD